MTPFKLAVVVATTEPWPTVRECLDKMCLQARAVGAEIILADGGGSAVTEEYLRRNENVRWLKLPGMSVFGLRAQAFAATEADIIAMTEDHCLVNPDWCERILEAHNQHPDALAIGGAVVNGSPRLRIDRASFFLTFAPFLPPLASTRITRSPPPGNVSYKRSAIPDEVLKPGWIELVINPRLAAAGAVVMENKIRVSHVQSHGFWGTCAAHFHNGRSSSGLIVQSIGPAKRRENLARCMTAPIDILRETLRTLSQKEVDRSQILESIPLVTLLAVCHTVGMFTGLIRGPGNSPVDLG
jgi:hypothetical protein